MDNNPTGEIDNNNRKANELRGLLVVALQKGKLCTLTLGATQKENDRLRKKLKKLQREIDHVAYVGTINDRRAIYFTREPVEIGACPTIANAVEDVDLRFKRESD